MGKVRWSTGVCSLPQDLHSINTATTPLFWDRIQVGTGTVRVRYGTLRYGTVAGEPCRGRIPFLGSRLKLYRGRQSFPSLFSVRASSPEKHFTFHNSQEVSQRTSCCAVYDLHILIDLAADASLLLSSSGTPTPEEQQTAVTRRQERLIL